MTLKEQGVFTRRPGYKTIPRTLIFITHGADVLLLKGSPSKRTWAGLYNGVGGHVEPGEDVWNSARREACEETGLQVEQLYLCGILNVETPDPNIGVMLFVMRGEAKDRETTPSHEGTLHWFASDQLPTADVVEDLPMLLTRALAQGPGDSPFFAAYSFDNDDRLLVTFAENR